MSVRTDLDKGTTGANALETPINIDPIDGTGLPFIHAFLELLDTSRQARGAYDQDIEKIDDLIDEAGSVGDTSNTPKKTNSQIIPLATHKAMSKTRFPFYWLESDTLPGASLNVVSSAFYDLVERSDLVEVYENKSGGMKRTYEVGDSLIKFNLHKDSKLPQFSEENFKQFFPQEFATEMRTASGERSVRKCVVTFMYSWEQAVSIFEEFDFKKKATIGMLPNIGDIVNSSYTSQQSTVMDKREVEVGVGYDLDNMVLSVFAGQTAAPITEFEGKTGNKAFPYFKGKGKRREPYIPLVHLRCITKSKGFPNLGWGQLFYKIALAERRNKNSGLVYMDNNVNAKQVVTIGNMRATEWNKHVQIADEYIAKGRQGLIPIRADREQSVNLTTLRADALTDEFERSTEVINKDVVRWFNIDSNITDTKKTLGAIELEEESQDLILREIAKNNVNEIKFALELIINFLENDVEVPKKKKDGTTTKGNDLKLKVKNKLQTGETVTDMSGEDAITLGELAQVFKEHDITVRVQGESGIKSSNALLRARQEAGIAKLAQFNPQNPAIPRLMQENFATSGLILSDEEAGAVIGQNPQGSMHEPSPEGSALPDLQKMQSMQQPII